MTDEASLAQSLICLNNEALGMFLEGRLREAIEVLSYAYTLFDSFQKKQHPVVYIHPNSQPQIAQVGPCFDFERGIAPADDAAQRGSSPERNVMCNPDFADNQKLSITSFRFSSGENMVHSLYNRGLMLSLDPTLSEGDAVASLVTTSQNQTSAILLYNLALCYHNMGSHLGVSFALPQALQLYQMALESIDRGTDLLQVQKLLMAILNNCANIYTYYRRTEETRRCFENLKRVLAASTVDMVLDEDYDFFFLNAFFQSQELWFAPAA
jgi:tetratricopeptide (TPR) repeat protein